MVLFKEFVNQCMDKMIGCTDQIREEETKADVSLGFHR